jgi:hypothetical protein
MPLTKDQLISLICTHCDFYREDDRDYECAAFKMLRGLLERGLITPEEVGAAFPR